MVWLLLDKQLTKKVITVEWEVTDLLLHVMTFSENIRTVRRDGKVCRAVKINSSTYSSFIDASRAIALYSPQWEAFANGRLELQGNNVPGFLLKQSRLREFHQQQQWRDLASAVMDVDHKLDLSYHYLSFAAKGLGHEAASLHYMERARQLSENKDTSCTGSFVISCLDNRSP